MDDSLPMETIEVRIEGMSCERCVARVEAAVREIPGVEAVNAAIGQARVVYQPDVASRAEIGLRIEGLGYRLAPADGKRKSRFARWLDRMGQANAKAFGTARLDCCTLGRKRPDDTAAG